MTRIHANRPICYRPVMGRVVELVHPVVLTVRTKSDGVIRVYLSAGFRWNGRSGGPAVDLVAPNQGTQEESIAWAWHDACGYPDTITAELDNIILHDHLQEACGYSALRAAAVYRVVQLTRKSWKADDWDEVDQEYQCNKGKIKLTWYHK